MKNNSHLRLELNTILIQPISLALTDTEKEILPRIINQANHVCRITGAFIAQLQLGEIDEYEFLTIINCHAYTLGLWSSSYFRKKAEKHSTRTRENIVDGSMMAKLIKKLKLTQLPTPTENCLVIYSNNIKITHSGIMHDSKNQIVESKWGVLPVLQHSLWDVPETYGLNVSYYILPTQKEIKAFFSGDT